MRIALLAVTAMAVLSTASAVTYDVGGPSGAWDLSTDYGTWVSDKKFVTGDSIVFKYSADRHDVLEVSKANYDSCTTTGAITTSKTGEDTVLLSAAGTRYFICGVGSHCNNGMKVTIAVGSGSSPSPPAPASGPSASNSPPPPPTSSAATSVGVTTGLGLVVLLAGLMA